jgi:hypothetical protein
LQKSTRKRSWRRSAKTTPIMSRSLKESNCRNPHGLRVFTYLSKGLIESAVIPTSIPIKCRNKGCRGDEKRKD